MHRRQKPFWVLVMHDKRRACVYDCWRWLLRKKEYFQRRNSAAHLLLKKSIPCVLFFLLLRRHTIHPFFFHVYSYFSSISQGVGGITCLHLETTSDLLFNNLFCLRNPMCKFSGKNNWHLLDPALNSCTLYICNVTINFAKMAHHSKIFTQAIYLKCLNFENKAISCPICNWMIIL